MEESKILRLYIDTWIHCNQSHKDCSTCPVCRYSVGNSSNLCETLTIAIKYLLDDIEKKYLTM